MKIAPLVTLALFASMTSLGFLGADDKKDAEKEVKLEGTIMCAKCALKEKGKCVTVIEVKEGEKKTVYYLEDKGMKEEYHEAVCGGEREKGTVTGKVTEKDGKKWVKPTKVEYAKKK